MHRMVVLAVTLPAALATAAGAPAADLADPARRAELVQMLRHDCGACHGLTLKGGLGPSLEPQALAGRDAGELGYVIQNGRRGTPMPPWRGLLSDDEARWIAELLKRGVSR